MIHQQIPYQPTGYASNVYSGGQPDPDQTDLQDLLDNIRPDEELEEGVEQTPAELSINLMKHQRLGLTWLKRMEDLKSKGGILADDMGLGKTIQAIALILSNKPKDLDYKTTLIIAPVSLLRQWAAEIESKLKSNCALKIAIYHGGVKKSLAKFKDIESFDVLLTSYGTLSSEWKRHFKEAIASFKSEKKDSIATFMPRFEDGGKSYKSPFFCKESTFHRIILDEAQNIKNKSSLASKSVTYLKGEFRLCLSGTPIQNNVDELYPILRFLKIRPYDNEFKFRLDISVPLRSNSENYDDFEKGKSIKKLRALLKAILLRRVKDSLIDGKPILSLPEKHVISDYVDMNQTEKEYYTALESGIQKKAKKLLNSKTRHSATGILTLLLRLRQACCHWFLVEIGEIKSAQSKKSEDDLNNPKDWRKMYAQVVSLDAEIVERIKALDELSNKSQENEAEITLQNDEDMLTCPICYNVLTPSESITILPRCGHMICHSCIDIFFENHSTDDENGRFAKCVECQNNVHQGDLIDYEIFRKVHNEGYGYGAIGDFCKKYYAPSGIPRNNILIEELIAEEKGFNISAKIGKAMELIQDIFTKLPDEKIIIFSQFTVLFDVIKFAFDEKGIDFLRYDGSMSLDAKNTTIKRFYQENVKVLLLSLKAGNTGLTLTCASHVIIMDPFWNPFVEEQAMDRAYRIGQEREVFVHRILISGTVESRIMELQERKKELVQSALDEKGMKSVSRLGQQELGFLFGLNSLLT
ncbi:uncharacterized protein CANTADRAFT_54768 [Suhomyces tanzawaensis NRRL Y-17324]|uniref:Uncharacterized protein n=1 Tax=Suhomyces tanzawaensis NRRL Y-17324 TaxID=984487 RepID=A0A1E4SE21_9ASCO|nr:uncharacterized protein CANTADRAFT_54768 [Suhomyces tanzawaensis NRRL Y-17324]ODV77728.1 hypothetical protein CANTADRAFT_54768 [Suhomyces tanzawaensis NRRL Y-17324]